MNNEPAACRHDGRCQYAIDVGMEGAGSCSPRCLMPGNKPAMATKAVCHTDQEMRRMQEAGTLPKNVAAWLVYCDGEPGVRPELRHHFGWCEWHSPVWVPLVYMPAAPAA